MNSFRTPYQLNFGPPITKQLKRILLLNIGIFLVQQFDHGWLTKLCSLQPALVVQHLQIWRLITYAFLHGSFGHIFFNMFTLWMFGRDIEIALGEKAFLKFYLLTALGAGIMHLLFSWNSMIPVVGASGAIYGILVAFAVLFPHRELYLLLFFIFPVRLKARTLAIGYIAIALFMGIKSTFFGIQDHIAHLAHLGGAATGFVLLRWQAIYLQIDRKIKQKRALKIAEQTRKQNEQLASVKKKVDEILDRINQVGYANISDEEKKVLHQASEYLSKQENSRNR